ncbi:hypothetical protein Tco_1572416 [Tanacetum coccineum]
MLLSTCVAEGSPVSMHVIKMIWHISRLERLGHPIAPELAIDFIFNSINKEYKQFILSYNMNNVEGGTVAELHNMLKTVERGIDQKSIDVLVVENETHGKNGGRWKGRESKGKKNNSSKKNYLMDLNPRKGIPATSAEKKGTGRELIQMVQAKKDKENIAKTLEMKQSTEQKLRLQLMKSVEEICRR